MKKVIEIRVASNSRVRALAGSIVKSIEAENVEVVAVGAGAVNQAVKAIAMARGFLSVQGKDLYVAPGFVTIDIEGNERTALKFVLKIF